MAVEFDIKEYLLRHTPYPDNISQSILNLDDLLVYDIDYGSNDPNEPIKVICAPKMEAIYPDTAGTPVCYHCGSVISRLQQYKNRSIDDFPIQGRRTILEVLYTTRYCVDCKKTYSPKLLCAEDRARLTNRHAAAITESAFEKKTFSQTAYDMHVSVALVESLFRAETKRREQNIFYEAHEHIGIDETKVHTKDKQKRMCIVIMQTNRDTVQEPTQKMSSLIALEQSRLDTESVIELLNKLDRPEIVKTVSMDMSAAYRNAVEIVLPDARIIVDRFHLVKSLNDKVRKVASSLYEKTKAELERAANTKVDTSFIDDDLPFELEEKEREIIAGNIDESEPQSDAGKEARKKLSSLVNNYNNKRFGVNSDDLAGYSAAKQLKLFRDFPEFKTLYLIKEIMRDKFFKADTADQARKIADETEKMIPKGRIYSPLRTYFKTLNNSEWTPYIYDYFSDPIGKRHSNAALESINSYIKDVNRESRGLTWEVLHNKILFGRTKVKQRPRRWSRENAKNFLDLFIQGRNKDLMGIKVNLLNLQRVCARFCLSINKENRCLEFIGSSNNERDDLPYNKSIMEPFYEAIAHGGVFESDENEDVTVYEPIIMESILNYRDFYIGLLSEDASDLKRHDPPPYDEADEFCREHILTVGDMLNKYILSSWIPK